MSDEQRIRILNEARGDEDAILSCVPCVGECGAGDGGVRAMSDRRWRIKATFPSGKTYLGDYVTDLDAWYKAEPLRESMRQRAPAGLQSYLALVPVDDDGNELPFQSQVSRLVASLP